MAAHETHLTLITGPRAYTRQRIFDLLIETALRQPVRVLLGGNDFPVYEIAYALAAQTGDVYAILEESIILSRAETGYQLLELLRQTPTTPTTTLAADLLSPLMDEGLREKEANQLLFACILELRRLGKAAPLFVSAAQPKTRPHLLMALTKAVQSVQTPPPGLPAPQPQTSWPTGDSVLRKDNEAWPAGDSVLRKDNEAWPG